MDDPTTTQRRSYPLSALFVLMAACAVVTALVTPVSRAVVAGDVGVSSATMASAVGAIVVMLLGAIVGLHHYRRGRGVLIGSMTGVGIGLICGPIVLSPASAFPSLMSMSAGGAMILIIVGIAFRVSSNT